MGRHTKYSGLLRLEWGLLYDVPYITKLKMAKSTTFQHIVVDNKKMVAFDFLTNKKVQEEIFFTS